MSWCSKVASLTCLRSHTSKAHWHNQLRRCSSSSKSVSLIPWSPKAILLEISAPQLLTEFSSAEVQELTQDCSVAPWHRLSFDHQLDLHRGLLDRVEDGHTYGFLHPRAENRRCCNQITPEEHNWKWSVKTQPRECYLHLWDTFCVAKGKEQILCDMFPPVRSQLLSSVV